MLNHMLNAIYNIYTINIKVEYLNYYKQKK